uniref:Uncharacterized protein n=2 Tax=Trichobilharzia regenti TaxID=157069 RepID=A0AA85IZK0_TRIRE|nr:unnamed protein product [Trichobilharzia regenti]
MLEIQDVPSEARKIIDRNNSKFLLSTENTYSCGVIRETEIMTSDNKKQVENKQKQNRHTPNFKQGNRHPVFKSSTQHDKSNSETDRTNEDVEKGDGDHDDKQNSAKTVKKKWKHSVTYSDNVAEAVNEPVDNLLNTYSVNNYSGSSSSFSSLTESCTSQKDANSISPEAHLSKLKKIHRKASRRKKLKYFRKIFYFVSIRIILMTTLIASLIFLLVGYLISIRYMMITGCILSLTSAGCLIQLCFSKRTAPNKFNPQSVPFALAAEDLPQTTDKTIISPLSITTQNNSNTVFNNSSALADINTDNTGKRLTVSNTSSTVHLTPVTNTPLVIGIDQIQARRLSMALQRLTRNSIQPQSSSSYKNYETSGMLNMARRLTMATSAIAMAGNDRDYYGHSSWLTGSRVRHGVRRSLAWNDSGATRFYEQCYD